MKIICAWCRGIMRDGTGPISHGMCEACWPKVRAASGLPAKPYPAGAAA